MKTRISVLIVALFSVCLLSAANKDIDTEVSDRALERATVNSSQWSNAFTQLREKHDLNTDQDWLVERALELGAIAQFEMSEDPELWKQTKGQELKMIMTEAREVLSGNAYIELLLAMEQTQHMLHAVAVIPVTACDCNGLCDCNDVAPTYSRCQATACLKPFPTPAGWPSKVCQYR